MKNNYRFLPLLTLLLAHPIATLTAADTQAQEVLFAIVSNNCAKLSQLLPTPVDSTEEHQELFKHLFIGKDYFDPQPLLHADQQGDAALRICQTSRQNSLLLLETLISDDMHERAFFNEAAFKEAMKKIGADGQEFITLSSNYASLIDAYTVARNNHDHNDQKACKEKVKRLRNLITAKEHLLAAQNDLAQEDFYDNKEALDKALAALLLTLVEYDNPLWEKQDSDNYTALYNALFMTNKAKETLKTLFPPVDAIKRMNPANHNPDQGMTIGGIKSLYLLAPHFALDVTIQEIKTACAEKLIEAGYDLVDFENIPSFLIKHSPQENHTTSRLFSFSQWSTVEKIAGISTIGSLIAGLGAIAYYLYKQQQKNMVSPEEITQQCDNFQIP